MTQERINALQTAIETNLAATREKYISDEAELLSERLSLEDLHAATAFYQTPAGKRLADITPALVPVVGRSQLAWARAAI